MNPDFEMMAVPFPISKSYFRYFGGQPFLISSMLGVSAIGFDYAFILRHGNWKNRNNYNYCIQSSLFLSCPDSATLVMNVPGNMNSLFYKSSILWS